MFLQQLMKCNLAKKCRKVENNRKLWHVKKFNSKQRGNLISMLLSKLYNFVQTLSEV